MFLIKKWGILIKKESESLDFTGLEIPREYLYFKGDDSCKIAYVEVKVFGAENKEGFEKMTRAICDIYNEVLGIAPDKIYVKYESVSSWGWNGSNF